MVSNNEDVVYVPKEEMLHPACIFLEILNQWIYRETQDRYHQIHHCKQAPPSSLHNSWFPYPVLLAKPPLLLLNSRYFYFGFISH